MTQSDYNGLFAMEELNYQVVFTRNHFSYTGGVKTIFNDVDFSAMTYSECLTFFERFKHEEFSVYADHIGVGVDECFNDDDNEDDERESCIDGENKDKINDLRNVDA
ncbi:unnamed protein product [Lactuca virosa]|uniref:Uncharacterized protein n=1 Tax=Lactuca virosa TaxID=75947 RepID=A0AAU9LN89_9ASTR|nr:unnamed protein product [Lactuca virosa]CAH1429369.1 unnamed protein product [Lactuca virosa]